MGKYVLIALGSGILSSFSQVLLKKSANRKGSTIIKEYLNSYVISAYLITGICMLLMIISYKGIPYKFGPILESLVYVYIMILSRIFFGEKFTRNKLIGNILIVCGVIIFSLGS